MQTAMPKPDAVLVTGDFIAHRFPQKFASTAPESKRTDAVYRDFVQKTMAFVTLELKQTFPGIPILPVLGNNDADTGDYALEPDGSFLHGTAELANDMAGPSA